ncbi:MAG: SixA phosphatase family protein [Gammaproteobacteria bacterium]
MSDSREILIVRHADASSEIAYEDIDRPLTERGEAAARKLGAWMKEHVGPIDRVLSSSAARARQTTELLCESIDVNTGDVSFREDLYLAELVDLREVLMATHCQRLLLVGHNPGLADLVTCLVMGSKVEYEDRIHLPTCALAHLTVPSDLGGVSGGEGDLKVLVHPAALPEAV